MDGQNFDPSFGKLPSPVIEKPKAPEIKTQDFFPVKLKSGEVIQEPKRFTATGRKLIDADDEVKNAETEGAVQFASGVVRVSDAPQYQTPESTKLLYGETLGVTRYQALRTAVGLKDNESFTDYYKQNGFVPKGFELEAKLLLHEEKTKKLEQQYKRGEIGYDTFLFKAYGKELLKASGHDIDSSLYWYNRRKNGMFDSPMDDVVQLQNLLAQAESYYKAEEWFNKSNEMRLDETFASLLTDEPLPADKVRDLFPEAFEALDEFYESDEEKVRLYRAGMLSGLNPLIDVNNDGKPEYYFHTDGKLYRVAAAHEARGNEAKAYYNADGSLDRVVVNEFIGEMGDGFIKGLGSIFGTVVEIVGGLSVGLYDTMENLFSANWEYDKLADWYVGWQGTKNSTWLFNNNVFTTSSGFTNSDGTVDVDGIARGVSTAAGTIIGMIATAGLGAKLSAIGKGITVSSSLATKGLLAKGVSLSKLGIAKTGSLMSIATGLTNGMPVIPALAKTTTAATIQGLTFLAVRDWTSSVASLTARKEELDLTDAEIIGQSSLMTGINFAVSYAMRSVLDKSALQRHAEHIAGRINAAKGIKIEDVHTPFVDMVRSWMKNSPRSFMITNTLMDVAENLITMGTQTAVSQTGNILDAKSWASLWNPQVLATQLFVGITTYKGGFGKLNEGLETGGMINSFGRLNMRADEFRSEIKAQIDSARVKGDTQLADKFIGILRTFENDITTGKDANGKPTSEKNPITGLTRAFYNMHEMLKTENDSIVKTIMMKAYDVNKTSDVLAGIDFTYEMFKAGMIAQNKVYKDIFTSGTIFGPEVLAKVSDLKGKANRVFREFSTNLSRASQINLANSFQVELLARGFNLDVIKNSPLGTEAENLLKTINLLSGANIIEEVPSLDKSGKPIPGQKKYVLKSQLDKLTEDQANVLIDLAKKIGLNEQNILNGAFIEIPGAGTTAQASEAYERIRVMLTKSAELSTYGSKENQRSLIYRLGDNKFFIPYMSDFTFADSLVKINSLNKIIFTMRYAETAAEKYQAFYALLELKGDIKDLNKIIVDGKVVDNKAAKVMLDTAMSLYKGGASDALITLDQLVGLFKTDTFKSILELPGMVIDDTTKRVMSFSKAQDTMLEIKAKYQSGKKAIPEDLKKDLTKAMEEINKLAPAEFKKLLESLQINKDLYDEIAKRYLTSNPIRRRELLEMYLEDFSISLSSSAEDPELHKIIVNKIVQYLSDESKTVENLGIKFEADGVNYTKKIAASSRKKEQVFKLIASEYLKENNIKSLFNLSIDDLNKMTDFLLKKDAASNPNQTEEQLLVKREGFKKQAESILNKVLSRRITSFFDSTPYGGRGVLNMLNDSLGNSYAQLIFEKFKENKGLLPSDMAVEDFKLEDFFLNENEFIDPFSKKAVKARNIITKIAFLKPDLNLEANRSMSLTNRIKLAQDTYEDIYFKDTVDATGNNRVVIDLTKFVGFYESQLLESISRLESRMVNVALEEKNLLQFIKVLNIPDAEGFLANLNRELKFKDIYFKKFTTGVKFFDSVDNKDFIELLKNFNYSDYILKDRNVKIPGVFFKSDTSHKAVPIEFVSLEAKRAFMERISQDSQNRAAIKSLMSNQSKNQKIDYLGLIESTVGSYFKVEDDTIVLSDVDLASKVDLLLSDLGDVDDLNLQDVGLIIATAIGKIKSGRTGGADVMGLFFELTNGAGIVGKPDPTLRINKYFIQAIRLLGEYASKNNGKQAEAKPVLLERRLTDEQVRIIKDAGIWSVELKAEKVDALINQQSTPLYWLKLNDDAEEKGLAYLSKNKEVDPIAIIPLLSSKDVLLYQDGDITLASNNRGLPGSEVKVFGQSPISYVINNFGSLMSAEEFNIIFSQKALLAYDGHDLDSQKEIVSLFKGKTVAYILKDVFQDASVPQALKDKLKTNIYYKMLSKSLEGSLRISKLVTESFTKEQQRMIGLLGDANIRKIIGYGLNQNKTSAQIVSDVNEYILKPRKPSFADYKDIQAQRVGITNEETYLSGEDLLRLGFTQSKRTLDSYKIQESDIDELKEYLVNEVFTSYHFKNLDSVKFEKNYNAILKGLFEQSNPKNVNELNLFVDDLIGLEKDEFNFLINSLKGIVPDYKLQILTDKYNESAFAYDEVVTKEGKAQRLLGQGTDEPTFETTNFFISSSDDPNTKAFKQVLRNALNTGRAPALRDLMVKLSQAEDGLSNNKYAPYLSRLRDLFLSDDHTNNTMSRLIPNISLLRMMGEFISSIEIASKQLLQTQMGLNISKEQAFDLAFEMYLQSTGNDFSKEYGRYIIFDNQEGKMETIVEQTSSGYKSINEITYEVFTKYLGKRLKDGKPRYILFDLERNMFHNGSLGLNNKLKFMKLDNENEEFMQNLFYKNTWDQYVTERKTPVPTSPEEMMKAIQQVHAKSVSLAYIKSLAIKRFKDILPNSERLISKAFLKLSSYLAGMPEKQAAFFNTIMLDGDYDNATKEKYNIRESIINDILKYLVHWDELDYDLKVSIENSGRDYLNKAVTVELEGLFGSTKEGKDFLKNLNRLLIENKTSEIELQIKSLDNRFASNPELKDKLFKALINYNLLTDKKGKNLNFLLNDSSLDIVKERQALGNVINFKVFDDSNNETTIDVGNVFKNGFNSFDIESFYSGNKSFTYQVVFKEYESIDNYSDFINKKSSPKVKTGTVVYVPVFVEYEGKEFFFNNKFINDKFNGDKDLAIKTLFPAFYNDYYNNKDRSGTKVAVGKYLDEMNSEKYKNFTKSKLLNFVENALLPFNNDKITLTYNGKGFDIGELVKNKDGSVSVKKDLNNRSGVLIDNKLISESSFLLKRQIDIYNDIVKKIPTNFSNTILSNQSLSLDNLSKFFGLDQIYQDKHNAEVDTDLAVQIGIRFLNLSESINQRQTDVLTDIRKLANTYFKSDIEKFDNNQKETFINSKVDALTFEKINTEDLTDKSKKYIEDYKKVFDLKDDSLNKLTRAVEDTFKDLSYIFLKTEYDVQQKKLKEYVDNLLEYQKEYIYKLQDGASKKAASVLEYLLVSGLGKDLNSLDNINFTSINPDRDGNFIKDLRNKILNTFGIEILSQDNKGGLYTSLDRNRIRQLLTTDPEELINKLAGTTKGISYQDYLTRRSEFNGERLITFFDNLSKNQIGIDLRNRQSEVNLIYNLANKINPLMNEYFSFDFMNVEDSRGNKLFQRVYDEIATIGLKPIDMSDEEFAKRVEKRKEILESPGVLQAKKLIQDRRAIDIKFDNGYFLATANIYNTKYEQYRSEEVQPTSVDKLAEAVSPKSTEFKDQIVSDVIKNNEIGIRLDALLELTKLKDLDAVRAVYGKEIFIPVIRHPGDHVGSITFYKVKILTDTNNVKVLFSPDVMKGIHFGDFDGDHLTVIRPDVNVQAFAKGMFNYTKKGYDILDYILQSPEGKNFKPESTALDFILEKKLMGLMNVKAKEDLKYLNTIDNPVKQHEEFLKLKEEALSFIKKELETRNKPLDKAEDILDSVWIKETDISSGDAKKPYRYTSFNRFVNTEEGLRELNAQAFKDIALAKAQKKDELYFVDRQMGEIQKRTQDVKIKNKRMVDIFFFNAFSITESTADLLNSNLPVVKTKVIEYLNNDKFNLINEAEKNSIINLINNSNTVVDLVAAINAYEGFVYRSKQFEDIAKDSLKTLDNYNKDLLGEAKEYYTALEIFAKSRGVKKDESIGNLINSKFQSGSSVLDSFMGHFNLIETLLSPDTKPEFWIAGYRNQKATNDYLSQRFYETLTKDTKYYNNLELKVQGAKEGYKNWVAGNILIDLENSLVKPEDSFMITKHGKENLFLNKVASINVKDDDSLLIDVSKPVTLKKDTEVIKGIILEAGTTVIGRRVNESGETRLIFSKKKFIDGTSKLAFVGGKVGKGTLGSADLETNEDQILKNTGMAVDFVYNGKDIDFSKVSPMLAEQMGTIIYLTKDFKITTKKDKNKRYAVLTKVPLSVVEDTAFWNSSVKPSILDETSTANNARSLEGALLVGGQFVVANEDGTFSFDNRIISEAERFKSNYFSPLAGERNAMRLHHTLMYSILLNQVKDLTVEQKADMLQNFMNSNVAASKRGLNIINALFKNYFKDKGIKITDLKLSEVEQFVLSKEFYDQFKETNVNKVFESAKELFSKKAMARNAAQNYEHVIGDIGVAGKTAAIGGYSLKNTDEVLYDNSSGHLGQRDYLNLIISLHNQLNEKTGNTISHIRKTDTDAGLIRGVYNYDKGYLGGYQGNNFSSVSAQDSLIVGPSRFNSVNDSAKTGTPSWQTVIEAQARGYFLDDLPTNSLFDYYAKYFDPYDKTKKAKTNWGSRKFSNQIFNRFFDINEENGKPKIGIKPYESREVSTQDAFTYELMNGLSRQETALGRASLYGWTPGSFILNVEPKDIVYGNDNNYHFEFNQDSLGRVINNPDTLEEELKSIFRTYKYFDYVDKREDEMLENKESLKKKVFERSVESVRESSESFEDLLSELKTEIDDGTFILFNQKKSEDYKQLYREVIGEKINDKLNEAARRSVIEYNNGSEESLHRMFQVDLLETAGIKITDSLDIKASELLNRIQRDALYFGTDLSNGYFKLFELVSSRNLLKETNEYAKDKALLSIISYLEKSLSKTTNEKEKVKINLEINAHINSSGKTLEQAKASVALFEKNRGDIAYEIYRYNSKILEEARTISALNDEVADDVFWFLTPTIKNDNKAQKNSFVRQALFSYNKPENDKIVNMYYNYNYFDSMKSTIKQIVTSNSYRSFAQRAKQQGFMENSSPHNFVVEEIVKTFEPLLKEIVGKNDIEDYKILENMVASSFRDGVNFKETDSKKFGFAAGEKYFELFKRLRDFTLQSKKSYSDALSDLRMNPNDENSQYNKEIIQAYDFQNDIIAALLIKGSKYNNNIAETLFASMQAKANAQGLAVVDRFGRIFRNDMKDYRTLGPYSTEYVKSLFKYYSTFNGGFESNVLLDAINGDVFFMNKSLAEHADKYFFTTKVPGKVLKLFKTIASWATQLIMASPLKLVDRFLMFTGFDVTTLGLANPGTLLKLPEATSMLSEFLQSKGASLRPELKEYLIGRGVDITKQTTEAIFNDAKDGRQLGGPLKPWFDFVNKTLSTQHELGRFAFFLASMEDIKKNNGLAKNLGAAYAERKILEGGFEDVLDKTGQNIVLSKEAQQALFIMGRQIGAVGDFPALAKNLSGYLMFTTFPLAHLRWARGELKSFATATKELFLGTDDMSAPLRHLGVQGLGVAGIYLVMNLLLGLWGNQLNMDEDEIKELQDRQAVPELFKTIMLGKPMFNNWNSMNPFSLMYDMTAKPLVDAATKEDGSVLEGIQSLLLNNIASRGNPVIKTIAEVFGGFDMIGGSINDNSDKYGFWENVFRKSTGFILGGAGANALTNYLSKDMPFEDKTLLESIDHSINIVVAAELGNTRAFKTNIKNYYKATNIVNTYRFAENLDSEANLTQFQNSSFNQEGYQDLKSNISAALRRKAKPSVVYNLIQEALRNGLTLKEVRSAVNNNLLRYKVEQIKDLNSFIKSLTESEMNSVKDALAYENELFPWLDDLRSSVNDSYNRQNNYRPYTPRPQFRKYNAPFPKGYFNNQRRYNGNNYRMPYITAQNPYKAYRQSWYNLNPQIEEDDE